MTAIILALPAWPHATGDLVPTAGAWSNQHDTAPVWLAEGDTFGPCRNGSRARWVLVKTVGAVDNEGDL